MPVRKTESRLPDGFAAADLGQFISSSAQPGTSLISYLSTPIVRERLQNYVVFVTNASFAATVASYHWTFTDGGTSHTQDTSIGICEYTPQNLGSLSVAVELRSAANAVLDTLTLQQTVVPLNTALEQMIDEEDTNIPAAAHPGTSRELINDFRAYVDGLIAPAANPLFNKLALSLAYAAALQVPQVRRNRFSEEAAATLNNNNHANFLHQAEEGIGMCRIRPQLLAMFLNKHNTTTPYTAVTELPADRRQRQTTLTAIQTTFNALSENEKTDLFNLLRFPKANARMCKQVLEGLKDRYYQAMTMEGLLAVRDRARELITHYETGPLVP